MTIPFNPNATYQTLLDHSYSLYLFQNGVWYDQYGNTYPTVPYSKEGFFPPSLPAGGSGNAATDNIWQAAGDLIVGTGFHTATRLPLGAPLQVVQVNAGGTGLQYATLSGGGNALTSNPLSQFSLTTSAQLAGVISDETGTGPLVFGNSPTLTSPALGTPSSGNLSSCTGLPIGGITGLGAGVSAWMASPSSANLLSAVTGTTGSGSLVFANSPAFVTPALGVPSSGVLTNCTGLPVAGISGLATGLAAWLGTPTSANLAAAVTDETGSGSLVFGTGPTLSAPTLSGIVSTDGANITTASPMAALAIDVSKGLNTKSISVDSTFTFSGTPSTNQWFGMHVTNTDTNPHIVTIPSSFSVTTQTARTTFPLSASGQAWLVWRYDGAAYHVFGDSPYLSNFTASVNPVVTDDVTKGYGPGSLWGNTSANTLYWCEANAVGSAVWNLVGGTGAGDMLLAGVQTISGAKTFNDATLLLAGSTSGALTLHAPAVAATSSMTFPAGTDTVATLAAVQALTNKTYEGNTWTGGTSTLTGSAGKTLAWQNTITLAASADGATFTFPGTSDTVVGRTATQTLTNKTLTTPAINSPALTHAKPGANLTVIGTMINGYNAGATISQFQAVYMGSGGTWLLADADGSGTRQCRGLAAAAGTNGNPMNVLENGIARNDAWTWTPGGDIYLTTTAGTISQTAPASAADVRRVGYALSATEIRVMIDSFFVTV